MNRIIDRHNFIPIVCVSFTLIVCGKLLLEKLAGFFDKNYTSNIFMCLAISALVTGVLSLHYYLQKYPLLPVIIIQYAATVGAVFLFIWISGFFEPHSPDAYRDMFISVTIPYIVSAAVYYAAFFMQVRRANKLIKELNEKNE